MDFKVFGLMDTQDIFVINGITGYNYGGHAPIFWWEFGLYFEIHPTPVPPPVSIAKVVMAKQPIFATLIIYI